MYHYSYSSSSKEETTCSGNASGTEHPDRTDLFSPSTCNVTLHPEQYVEMNRTLPFSSVSSKWYEKEHTLAIKNVACTR